ncbi:NDP-hexose 2,3-dehydratase family protein [Saccharopolyspora gloriosae]|uniref:NDP-hexose 2,3-dehydratase family protein n=1 Tax=Saccharopolyspora gloriosae TaxID=455344 RepID=UPI001FB6CD3F|nr:NDP-hexose 2,3-dehydratase family protein [Saccharopolyspora gloriosae]
MFREISEFHEWFAERGRANAYEVTRTKLDELDGWHFDDETGNLVHRSGKFFSIEGLEISTDHREVESWTQPIILQPEIGILGILVTKFDGVPHCLMQAKMEPGNINLLQLSPTVQATRSNYTRVHQGSAVPYLEHFVAPRSGKVVFDALQSEQGSWFLHKRNRNMIVETTADVPVLDDFCWLTFDQLGALLREDNLINMDSRTVLSGLPFLAGEDEPTADPGPDAAPEHSFEQLLSWFTEARSRYRLDRRTMPLRQVRGWLREPDRIRHEQRRYFNVVGLDVRASNREVTGWSQPMIAPSDRGVIAFLGRRIHGVFHVLVQARTEAGTSDVVEMSPTVNCIPSNYRDAPADKRPRYLDQVLMAPSSALLLDVVHSEEGGRFYHAENRYLVVEADESFPHQVPDDFTWMTPQQLMGFVRHGNYVNVAARCLLTCMNVGRRAFDGAGRR